MVAVPNVSNPPLVDEAVGLTPRPYQTDGRNFLWRKERAMITDAPGLGKTPQAALAAEPPCMVVCPTYLTEQWGAWLRAHFPHRKVVVARGPRQDKTDAMLQRTDFLVINKEMLRTHAKELFVVAKRMRYKTLIIDEAHHLRNQATTASRNAVALGSLIPRVYLLTATPIWKEPDDLFMPLRILYPDVFTSYSKFVDTWCETDTSGFSTKVTGIKANVIDDLNELMDAIRIGRTYEQAGRDLPPVIETRVQLEFEPNERKRYDDLVATYRLQLEEDESLFMLSYMEVMHTLRNLTGFEKMGPIADLVEESRPYHNGKYVIFTWYRDIAERLAERLPEAVLITGDMKPAERVAQAKREKPIIATITALSEGVDLSWARMVCFAEEHWPPGSEVQTLARVRRERVVIPDVPVQSYWDEIMLKLDARQANEEPVLVYYTTVNKTIDDTIHETTRRRSATVKQVLKEALGVYL